MRRSAGVVFAIATVGLTPALANAEGGYEAQWVAQTPDNGTVIETGERLPASITMRNVGTAPWKDNVKLAPGDGATLHGSFNGIFTDESWLSSNRVVNVKAPPVAPQQEAKLEFTLKGPPVAGPTKVQQYLIPLAEGEYWMDSAIGTAGATWPTNAVHLDLEVRPSEPPTAAIDAAPAAVVAGQAVPITATVADNVRVTAVAARIDSQPVVALSGAPAQGSVPTTGIAPGAHTLTVAAVDGAGNIGVATAPLTISEDMGLANGTPAGAADLTAGLSDKRRSRLSVRAGKTAELGGRLRVKATKTAIAGAVLTIESRQRGSRSWRAVKTVATDRLGRYQTRIPAGPSRAVRVVYKAQTKQPAPTVAKTVNVETRAPVTLRIVRRGRVVRMIGRVTGSPFPSGGVLVSLQGRQAGDKWRPFQNVRARGKKRSFTGRYRFGGGGRFQLRAVVNEQSGYPYARGISNIRKVRVR